MVSHSSAIRVCWEQICYVEAVVWVAISRHLAAAQSTARLDLSPCYPVAALLTKLMMWT